MLLIEGGGGGGAKGNKKVLMGILFMTLGLCSGTGPGYAPKGGVPPARRPMRGELAAASNVSHLR